MATPKEVEMRTANTRLELWKKKHQEYQKSGLSRAAYCKKHRIPKSTLNYWFYRVRKLQKDQTTLVEVKPKPISAADSHVAVVVAERYRIEIHVSFNAQLFAEVVKALEGLRNRVVNPTPHPVRVS
jgi:hypothetical protein